MPPKQTGRTALPSQRRGGSKRARVGVTPEPASTLRPSKRARPQAQQQDTSLEDGSTEVSVPNPDDNLDDNPVAPAPVPSATPTTVKKKKDRRPAEQIILDDHRKHLPDNINNERAWIQEHCPPVILQDLDSVIGPQVPEFDEVWTQEMEAEFLQEWERSDMGQAFATLNVDSHKYLLPLWKQCIRIFRCSPFAIISPLRGFEYNESGNKEIEVNNHIICSPIWPSAFRTKLVQLLSLSLWEPNTHREMIVLFLQYAIICRSDDRRAWDMPLPTESQVLSSLKAAVRQGPLPCSVHEIHWYLRQASELPPSLESNILFAIGECVKLGNMPAPEVTLLGRPKYWVDSSDLDAVLNALHNFSGRGFPALKRTDEAHIISKESRGTELPQSSLLIDFQTRAWLHEMRQLKIQCMERASAITTSNSQQPQPLESRKGIWFRPGSFLGRFRQ